MWPQEHSPDSATVFLRVHRAYFYEGALNPGVFRDHQGGMSVDWDRYSSAEETKRRARRPEDNGVIALAVRAVRLVQGLSVVHEPVPANRAHSQVLGEKDEERRLKLSRLYPWQIPLAAKAAS
jgi:hypothetical protein